MKKLFTFLCIALVVELAVINYLQYRKGAFKRETVTDTVRLSVVDTVTYRVPVARDSVVVRHVTVKVARRDSGEIRPIGQISLISEDSVSVPIEQKRYTDDSTYTAYVSGYRPRLDSIAVYPRRETVTIQRTQTLTPSKQGRQSRLSFGLQAGYGVTPKGAQPYVGVGIGWRLFGF